MINYLHGVHVKHMDEGGNSIESIDSGIIGLVGTAPNADKDAFPDKKPVLVNKRKQLEGLGAEGTLKDALEGIFAQAMAQVVVVRVKEKYMEKTKHKKFVQKKVQETTIEKVNGEYIEKVQEKLVTEKATRIKKDKDGQDLKDKDGKPVMEEYDKPVLVWEGDYEYGPETEQCGISKGVEALLGAESTVFKQPKILIAPKYSKEKIVADKLGVVAKRLSAFALVDTAEDATNAKAIAQSKGLGNKRLEVVTPWVKIMETKDGKPAPRNVPASSYHAGVMAKTHSQKGFWWSNSNQPLRGIAGLARPIDYKIDDALSTANLLNAGQVTTIIMQGGFRSWGNRTTASETKWCFKNVVITNDMIADSLTRAHQWAIDRNITSTYVSDVVENVNSYLRHLTQIGAIAGGRCWADPELNSADEISSGKVCFDYEFSTFAPAEQITFQSRMTKNFLKEII
jgi:phage tail sheath protein FI